MLNSMVVRKTGQLRANLMLPEPAKDTVQDGLKLFADTRVQNTQNDTTR